MLENDAYNQAIRISWSAHGLASGTGLCAPILSPGVWLEHLNECWDVFLSDGPQG
jgi:hypothetical protein